MRYYLNPYAPILSDETQICFPITPGEDANIPLTGENRRQLEQLIAGGFSEEKPLAEAFGEAAVERWKNSGILLTQPVDRNSRYSRANSYFYLRGLGDLGEVLRGKHVLILGCGGIGSHVAWNMTAMGVGRIGLLDGDVVEESNLNRQLLYDQADIGRSKVAVLKEKLDRVNPDVQINAIHCRIQSEQEIRSLLLEHKPDCVVKSLDSPIYISEWLDAACRETKTRYVSGVMNETQQVLGPTYVGEGSAQFGDFFAFEQTVEKISGIGPSLSFELTQLSGALSEEIFKLLTAKGKLLYKNRMELRDNLTGGKTVFISARHNESRGDYTKHTLVHFLCILFFYLMGMQFAMPQQALAVAVLVYSLAVPLFLSGNSKEAAAYCATLTCFGVLTNLLLILVANRGSLDSVRTIISILLAGFTVLSLLLLLCVSLEVLLFGLKGKLEKHSSVKQIHANSAKKRKLI